MKEITYFRKTGKTDQIVLRAEQVTLAVDLAKVHVSIGHLQKQFGDLGKAHNNFVLAIVSVTSL